MAQATRSPGGGSKTQVQAESIPPEESQIGNPEKKRRRANLARHSRKCSVCHHPDREFIDDDYLRWISPEAIARQYKISHHSVVYRHVAATGLRTQRRASLRATLEHFIEEAQNVRVTAHSLVSAVRLYAQINDQGQWNPPTRRHIVEHHYFTESQIAQEVASVASAAATAGRVSNSENDHGSRSNTTVETNARAAKQETKGGSPPNTFAANSAAPFSESPENFPAVSVAPIATAAKSPARARWWRWLPSSKVSYAAGSQAATSAAHRAAPVSDSPENSVAVSIAPAPTKTKTTATPIATIYLQTNSISNRELLGLDHVATH